MTLVEQSIAGLLATLAMTLFTQIVFDLLQRPYDVVRILGNMILLNPFAGTRVTPPQPALFAANIIHYGIGIIFAIGYAVLIGVDRYSTPMDSTPLAACLAYGLAIGTVAILGWRIFFAIHPGAPPVTLFTYLFVIFMGHIVLSLALHVIYKVYAFSDIAAATAIPVCAALN